MTTMAEQADQLLWLIQRTRKRIVVIGDTMVDRWVHGRAMPCQDGCQKFVAEDTVDTPGGAANAQRSISNWGVETSLFGYATNDCPVKCRFVENGNILFRADFYETEKRDSYQWARDMALEMVPFAGAVLLSDYDKGFLTPEFIRQVVDLCAKHIVPCVADCKREPMIYQGCTRKGNSDYWFTHGKYLPDVNCVCTWGPLPPVIDGKEYGVNHPSVVEVNHVGAGDCFAAHLTLALAYGYSLKAAAAFAHSAGRVYVQHPHNRPPTPAEIAADMAMAQRETISTSTP